MDCIYPQATPATEPNNMAPIALQPIVPIINPGTVPVITAGAKQIEAPRILPPKAPTTLHIFTVSVS